jgi:hypothetical protein
VTVIAGGGSTGGVGGCVVSDCCVGGCGALRAGKGGGGATLVGGCGAGGLGEGSRVTVTCVSADGVAEGSDIAGGMSSTTTALPDLIFFR